MYQNVPELFETNSNDAPRTPASFYVRNPTIQTRVDIEANLPSIRNIHPIAEEASTNKNPVIQVEIHVKNNTSENPQKLISRRSAMEFKFRKYIQPMTNM